MGRAVAFALVVLMLLPAAAAVNERRVELTHRSANMYVAAVGQTADGRLVGVLSVLTLDAYWRGRGDVFVRTEPLAEVDMQGAARLAVDAAAEMTGAPADEWDYHFTVTTSSSIIGGPSAGGAMAMAAAAVLMNWTIAHDVAMTGMINPDLSIGIVGGVLQKAEAVARAGVKTFLIPAGEGTQTVTRSERQPDGSVVQRTEQIDMAEHARREWGLDVVEVEDLYDVVPRFTGMGVERPSTESDPTQEQRYLELMRGVSQGQVQLASTQLAEAQAARGQAQEEMTTGDRRIVDAAVASAEGALRRAANATDAQRYYQASSFAFQSLVDTRYARSVAGYHLQEAPVADYVRRLLNEADDARGDAGEDVKPTYPITASELGALAAAEIRLAESGRLVANGRTALDAGQAADALHDAAFAHERALGARWWWDLRTRLGDFEGSPDVTREGLEALADSYRASALLMIAYARKVVGSSGAVAARLSEAQAEVDRADDAGDAGRVAAQAYGSIHAISLVNAAMAALNPDDALRQRLDTLRQRTAYEIEAARAKGVEPVYAVSLFEFALQQEAADVAEAYEGYSHARMAARATLVAAGHPPAPARWSPIDDGLYSPAQRMLQGAAWAWLVLGGLPVAFGLALATAVATRRPGTGKDS